MTRRDGYPWAWVQQRAFYAMAPVRSRPAPAPGKPIQPRKLTYAERARGITLR